MRKELIELNKGGPIQRSFNHPLMLVLMFAACVGLIAWGLTRKKATAEELYAAAEPLMQSDQPADWRRAWTEYLEPLTERFPDNPHRDEIAAFQRKIQDVDRLDKALKQAAAEAPAIGGGAVLPAGPDGPAKRRPGRRPGGSGRTWCDRSAACRRSGVGSNWRNAAWDGSAEPPSGDRFASARAALAAGQKAPRRRQARRGRANLGRIGGALPRRSDGAADDGGTPRKTAEIELALVSPRGERSELSDSRVRKPN